MSYTYVSKPTGSNYTYVNIVGKKTYDESSISYDDSTVYYDSFSPVAWTNISKPSDGQFIIRGMTGGLLIPLTYAQRYQPSAWIKVAKPSS